MKLTVRHFFYWAVAFGSVAAAWFCLGFQRAFPIALAACALAILPLTSKDVRPRDTKTTRLDAMWLIGNVAVAVILALCMFVVGAIQQRDAIIGIQGVMGLLCAHLFAATVMTMLIVGIPSRLILNLAVPERRIKYRRETVALVIALLAVAWMFYAIFTSPPD